MLLQHTIDSLGKLAKQRLPTNKFSDVPVDLIWKQMTIITAKQHITETNRM